MSDIRYCFRLFKDNKYLYSLHCSIESFDEVRKMADDDGYTYKILAYKSNSEYVDHIHDDDN